MCKWYCSPGQRRCRSAGGVIMAATAATSVPAAATAHDNPCHPRGDVPSSGRASESSGSKSCRRPPILPAAAECWPSFGFAAGSGPRMEDGMGSSFDMFLLLQHHNRRGHLAPVAAMNVNTGDKAEPIAASKAFPSLMLGIPSRSTSLVKSDVAQWTARTADANTKMAMSWI